MWIKDCKTVESKEKNIRECQIKLKYHKIDLNWTINVIKVGSKYATYLKIKEGYIP